MSISVQTAGNPAVLATNSTATPLNAGATFTGAWVDVSAFASVVASVKTDQAGTLYMDFGPDGTNADSTLSFAFAANDSEGHRRMVRNKYFRIRITNTSASNQTFLRAQALAGDQGLPSAPLNSIVGVDADATVTRPFDFNLLTAKNLYQGHTANIKEALKADIDAGSTLTCDLSNELLSGASYTGFPINPIAAEVVVAGADTGTVYYSYMPTNTSLTYTFGSVAVTGAGTYALGHNIWRCNFAYFVKNSDTALTTAAITVRSVGAANTFCRIDASMGQSFCGAFTVPYLSNAFLGKIRGNVKGATTGTVEGFFWYRPFGESPRYRFPFEMTFGSVYRDDVDYFIRIPSRTDIIPRVTYASANNLSARFTYRLIRVEG